ncbi:MAG: glycogen synthase, partial [Gemmatimonadetes bacterium]|nr:glycogen synthase [Gemmatimonadota bacterium]
LEEAAEPGTRARHGRAARERATTAYGWDTHCRALDEVLRAAARS